MTPAAHHHTGTPSFAAPYAPKAALAGLRRHLCDIDALLQAQHYSELDAQLNAALDASFGSREAEERCVLALPADLGPCIEAGPAGLARLRAWQAAAPASGFAHLCEAFYWYEWAYEYRGSGWGSTVSSTMWICASAAATHMAASVLKALGLSSRLWMATVLMMQGSAAFGEPDWLTELVQHGKAPAGPVHFETPAAQLEPLASELARSGMSPTDAIHVVRQRPEALLQAVQAKKRLKGVHYWMRATWHIHPQLFNFLHAYVGFLQPRWGGSHKRVAAFIASPDCAHLSAIDKDRLSHELCERPAIPGLTPPPRWRSAVGRQSGGRRRPSMGQQLVDAVVGMAGQPLQHVTQVGPRLVPA